MKKQFLLPILFIAVLVTVLGVIWAISYGTNPVTPTEPAIPVEPSKPEVPSDEPAKPDTPTQACIFYVPHPDDEVLNMGAAIIEAQKHFDPVILVLLTKGTASATLNVVSEKLSLQGLAPLTRDELGESRLMDIRESAANLGIKPYNIYLNDLPDGQVSSEDVKDIILSFEAMYPRALHQTMTWDDTHPDHRAAGTALRELQVTDSVADARYIVFLLHWDQHPDASITAITSNEDKAKYEAALNAYHVWNPEEGRYSVGILSTKTAFDFAAGHKETHWIKLEQ